MISLNNLVLLAANPKDDEYLSSVYLEFAEQDYFTVAFNEYEKDKAIHIEYSAQSQSIQSNNIDYLLLEKYLIFSFDDEIKDALNLNKNVFLIKLDIKENKHNLLKKSLEAVFKKT